jgi:hypothetical protein
MLVICSLLLALLLDLLLALLLAIHRRERSRLDAGDLLRRLYSHIQDTVADTQNRHTMYMYIHTHTHICIYIYIYYIYICQMYVCECACGRGGVGVGGRVRVGQLRSAAALMQLLLHQRRCVAATN